MRIRELELHISPTRTGVGYSDEGSESKLRGGIEWGVGVCQMMVFVGIGCHRSADAAEAFLRNVAAIICFPHLPLLDTFSPTLDTFIIGSSIREARAMDVHIAPISPLWPAFGLFHIVSKLAWPLIL